MAQRFMDEEKTGVHAAAMSVPTNQRLSLWAGLLTSPQIRPKVPSSATVGLTFRSAEYKGAKTRFHRRFLPPSSYPLTTV